MVKITDFQVLGFGVEHSCLGLGPGFLT